jgi:superfamily I DNA and/or RNA helicase/very-short-patch-repair endonuclease
VAQSSNQETRTKLIQIFRYLQALNHVRNPVQREIQDQPWVIWLNELPVHATVQVGASAKVSDNNEAADSTSTNEDADTDDSFILKVGRPKLTDPPDPPRELLPWLQPGWQQVDGKVSVATTLQSSGSTTQPLNFRDNLARERLLNDWKARRDKWAEEEQPVRRAFALFEKLYALQNQLDREGERLELMLGDGLLTWNLRNGLSIHHPVLLFHLQLRFNPEIPEFRLIETGQSPEYYSALFQAIPDVAALDNARTREELEQGNYYPLEEEETNRFLKRLINRLSPHGMFVDGIVSHVPQHAPCISRDPVIFLRPRTLGISTALESILEILPESSELPFALSSLTGIAGVSNDYGDDDTLQRSFDSPNGEDEHILLSKPANAEQLEIAQILEKKGAVLVQGPPGTGKTHTIANLIGHLLAQGKSVLVTSEKPKALRVLREQVVPPLQPLCVSILEDDNRKQLESTIDAISERLSHINARRLEHETITLSQQRIKIINQLKDHRHKLIEARGSEYRPLVLAGTSFSPAEAARYVAQHREVSGWIPEPVVPGAALPLSETDLQSLYFSNSVISAKDEQEMGLLLPETSKLISPIEFEDLIRNQAQLVNEAVVWRQDLWQGMGSLEAFQALQKRLVREVEPLRNLTRWQMEATIAGYDGGVRQQVWSDLIQEIEQAQVISAHAQLHMLKFDLFLPPDCLTERVDKVLDEIIEYLSQGGKLNRLKLLIHRDWQILLTDAKVNGKSPEKQEHFEALRYAVQMQKIRANLAGRWQRQMVILGEPDVVVFGPEPERNLYQYVEPLRNALQWYASTWMPLENELKKQGFQWEIFLSEMPINRHEYGNFMRIYTAVMEKLPPVIKAEGQRRLYAQNNAKLVEMERSLEQVGTSTNRADVVQCLYFAVKKRDVAAYRESFEKLANLHTKQQIFQQRRTMIAALERSAPGWATAIRERQGIHGKQQLPGNAEEAWLWRQMNDELDQRTRISLEELQDRITQLNQELLRITAELVEKLAWMQQAHHTTLEQQRALQGWRELMRKVGKGKGKRAPRLLAEARKLMPVCQTAVPVWIMPLSYIARNFDMKRNRFDVVIIDEASQADITALIAVYLGKQVIVVGDHEQVSPMAVGQRAEEVQHLIDEHLKGIPLAQMYDGKLSIYDLAKTTFQMVCLLEHFRCVSPIIQFSNELSYQGKIKPLRDDSEVYRRPALIAYQVKSFSKNGKVNEEEAYAVVSLLLAAVEQPEYKDATFGVISMVGGDQALYIESLLRRYMPAKEFVDRRVLCGDAAQFQGDERDVMFLSMVDVPNENGGPLFLRAEEGHDDMFKKRFNVAASRARDQMWVVYSLDPDNDLKTGDIRRRLILYARNQHLSNDVMGEQAQKVESEFERQVFERLVQAGYRVITQWPVGAYRIDMVVEGNGKRLAIECDGDRWHTQENLEEDMLRQAILERLGWRFVRIRGSLFFRNPQQAMEIIFAKLRTLGILAAQTGIPVGATQDGKDLKARIIRRADELLPDLKAQQSTTVSSETPLLFRKGYPMRKVLR